MRVFLTVLVLAALAGCATKRAQLPTVQPTLIHNERQTLAEVCATMREYTVQAGVGRLGRRERHSRKESQEKLTQMMVHPVLRADMAEVLNTVYLLPIKTYEDVQAFAAFVHTNCIKKNQ